LNRCRWLPLLLGALALAAGEIQLRYPTVAGSVPIKTWKDRWNEGIVKQTLDASCGSAATATILRAFYGQDITAHWCRVGCAVRLLYQEITKTDRAGVTQIRVWAGRD